MDEEDCGFVRSLIIKGLGCLDDSGCGIVLDLRFIKLLDLLGVDGFGEGAHGESGVGDECKNEYEKEGEFIFHDLSERIATHSIRNYRSIQGLGQREFSPLP